MFPVKSIDILFILTVSPTFYRGDSEISVTDTVIRNAKPKDKPYKITDGRGLYLLVNKVGKYFRWDYRFAGKRKTLDLGVYTDIKLKDAREQHEDMRRLLARGLAPMELIRQSKKMKMRNTHFVPLSSQSISVLRNTLTNEYSRGRLSKLKNWLTITETVSTLSK